MANDQVTPKGDQDPGNQDPNQSLGWRAALPDEYKEHEFVKPHTKPGDFVKSALQVKTERDALKTKLDGAIFKPGEKATDAEKAAFHKALGVPEKPEEYEFRPLEGVEHDPAMIKWAGGTFHKAGLTKEQAAMVSEAYDQLTLITDKQNEEAYKLAEEKAHKDFRTQFKSDDEYKAALELTTRVWKKVTDAEFDEFCKSTGLGNHPLLVKFIYNIAKRVGEDVGPAGAQRRGDIVEGKPMQYPNSPVPPKNV